MYADIGRSLGTDYFHIADQLTESELDCWRRTRDFVDNDVLPVINTYWERAEFPFPLLEPLGKLNVVGDDIVGYGCPGLSPIAAGLVLLELNRGDGSLGSAAKNRRWLARLARLDAIGAFALTEPAHGSDSVSLETSAHRDGRTWTLNGSKRWIGNATIADVLVVWARDTADN